jgi:DNA-directed RNA polymerase specialized sigma subunit
VPSLLDSEHVSYSVRAVRDLQALRRQQLILATRGRSFGFAEVGRRLGVSRERARQIEDRAKRKLRKRIPACRGPVFNESLGHFVRRQAFDAPAL